MEFRHLTYQEYLAALEVLENRSDQEQRVILLNSRQRYRRSPVSGIRARDGGAIRGEGGRAGPRPVVQSAGGGGLGTAGWGHKPVAAPAGRGLLGARRQALRHRPVPSVRIEYERYLADCCEVEAPPDWKEQSRFPFRPVVYVSSAMPRPTASGAARRRGGSSGFPPRMSGTLPPRAPPNPGASMRGATVSRTTISPTTTSRCSTSHRWGCFRRRDFG